MVAAESRDWRLATRARAGATGRVGALLVDEGMRVRSGDWLASIVDAELDRALLQGRALVPRWDELRSPSLALLREEARQIASELELAQLDLRTVHRLAQGQGAASYDVARAARRVERLAATLAQHERRLAAAELDLAHPRRPDVASWAERAMREIVRAPVSGVLRRWLAAPGEHAALGSGIAEIEPR